MSIRLYIQSSIDTFGYGLKGHWILSLNFSRKYTIRLGTRGHFYDLETNQDQQQNRKEILNKPGGTEK